MVDHREETVVRAFLLKDRRARSLFLLADRDRRRDFIFELDHFRWLDPRYSYEMPKEIRQSVKNICRYLRSKGAPKMAYVMSTDRSIDGKEIDLEEAIKGIRGAGMGTIVSCIPGKLAYYEGEDEALILERQTGTPLRSS